MAALSFMDVRYAYPGTSQPALDGVTLDVEPGELVLIVGESGCGKSTLLRAALGLVPHFHGGELAGRVMVDGLDTRDHRPGELARHAGLVFQDPEAQLVAQRVRHEVAFGLESIAHPPATIAARAQEALMAAGASHLTERDTGTLSGGEGQRIAIASVLAMGQPLLLLDEPTSQLDPVAAEELLALVTRINRDRGVTVVLAEHRTGRLFAEADRVVVMDAGRIAFDGAPPAAARHLAGGGRWMLPPVAQAFAAAGREELPLTVRDARRELGDVRSSPPPLAVAHECRPDRQRREGAPAPRRCRGAARRQRRVRRGHGDRRAGRERRGQVVAGAGRRAAARARSGPRARIRPGRLRQPESGAPPAAGDGRGRGGLRPRAERRAGAGARGPHGRRAGAVRPRRRSPTGIRATCRAASGSGSRWRR